MLFCVFEQFYFHSFITIVTQPFSLTFPWITNLNYFLVITIFMIALMLYSFTEKFVWLSKIQWIHYTLVNFINGILSENIKIHTQIFLPSFYFLFIFLYIVNLAGLTPYSLTVTSYFVVTLFISFSFFIAINIIGVSYNGLTMFNLLLPGGTPAAVKFFMVALEMISYFSRIFSLSIRLFANMMSGHILLKILSGFCVYFFAGLTTVLWTGIPFIVIVFAYTLEFLIAFLQAYVFVVLLSMYMDEVIHPH